MNLLPPAWGMLLEHAWGLGDSPERLFFFFQPEHLGVCLLLEGFCFCFFFPSKVSKYNHIKGLKRTDKQEKLKAAQSVLL